MPLTRSSSTRWNRVPRTLVRRVVGSGLLILLLPTASLTSCAVATSAGNAPQAKVSCTQRTRRKPMFE